MDAAARRRSSVSQAVLEPPLQGPRGLHLNEGRMVQVLPSPHANATVKAQVGRRRELPTTLLRLPFRRGRMAVCTPHLDTATHFLAGREVMHGGLIAAQVPGRG